MLFRMVVVCFFFVVSVPQLFAINQWGDVPAANQEVLRQRLPSSLIQMDENAAVQYITQFGTRATTYDSSGLLLRNSDYDSANATLLLRHVVGLQIRAPGRAHGSFPDQINGPVDYNWREFVGLGLIVIIEEFGSQLPQDLVTEIRRSLLFAAEGALARNVAPSYTNIAVMSAFLMDYVGRREANAAIAYLGYYKAREITELYYRDSSFSEFNSPTYYGVTLFGLACWRRFGGDEIPAWAARLEASLWNEISQTYHPGLRTMSGPATRTYGIDMNDYVTHMGFWIGIGLEDINQAPLPRFGQGGAQFEWASFVIYQVVGGKIPAELIPKFTDSRPVPNTLNIHVAAHPETGLEMDITVVKQPTWMMGAGTGFHTWSGTRVPATIHWKIDGSPKIGWLQVPSESWADVRIVDGKMQFFVPRPIEGSPFVILVRTPRIEEDFRLGEAEWIFPGAQFSVSRNILTSMATSLVDDSSGGGRVLRIEFRQPNLTNVSGPVLELIPRIFAE